MIDWEEEFEQLVGMATWIITAIFLIVIVFMIARALLPEVSSLPSALVGGLVTATIIGIYLKGRYLLKEWR